jgi:hypothetical protein
MLRRFTGLTAAIVVLLSVTAVGATNAASTSLLPRHWIVPLKRAERFFPQVTKQASTGKNTTSSGKPIASRQVIYASHHSSRKVTLSVDRYSKPKRASGAFKEAVRKSKEVSGFKPLPKPKVGQKSFAGTVTQGNETHVGVIALQGSLIMQSTIAGYKATDANVSRIARLTRKQVATAKRKCSKRSRCYPR